MYKPEMAGLLETQGFQDRHDRLQELTEFTEGCKKQLQDIFETLEWSQDDTGSDQNVMEQCPYDPNHRVPVKSMERHKASCSLRQMGYTAEEQAEMYDPSVCYEGNKVRTFTMDKSMQHQVILQARSAAPLMKMEGVFWQGQYSGQPVDVPQTHKRAVCDLTVADRLALYDHVVDVLAHQRDQAQSSGNEDLYVDLVKKLQKDEQQNEPKTHLELIAEMRDYKRRRQSYRAKNVHITKKSYTEVIREVISVHSEELARQWREDEKEQETRSEYSHRHRLGERHSASPESPHSHSKHHRSRERSQDREGKKKKKKKRERDSHSPDDYRHHEHKKKKKKKKDDREKEK